MDKVDQDDSGQYANSAIDAAVRAVNEQLNGT
jgi:hypothetical protein